MKDTYNGTGKQEVTSIETYFGYVSREKFPEALDVNNKDQRCGQSLSYFDGDHNDKTQAAGLRKAWPVTSMSREQYSLIILSKFWASRCIGRLRRGIGNVLDISDIQDPYQFSIT